MYELAVQRSEAPIIFSCRFRHGSNPSVKDEEKYWGSLLERIINVIKFLCERGLVFRRTDETVGPSNNRNYLGLLELLATVDLFLCKLIKMHAIRGKEHTSFAKS